MGMRNMFILETYDCMWWNWNSEEITTPKILGWMFEFPEWTIELFLHPCAKAAMNMYG